MLDKIQNNSSDAILENQGLASISSLGSSNAYKIDKSKYFVDESEISDTAIEKYQHEQDVKKFSEILLNSDEQEANSMVLSKMFEGNISYDDEDIFSSLLTNKNLLNDINGD